MSKPVNEMPAEKVGYAVVGRELVLVGKELARIGRELAKTSTSNATEPKIKGRA